jgi:hypothetical protein
MSPPDDVGGDAPLRGTGALRRLVELAAEEHRLAAEGTGDGLAEVQDGLEAALADLPSSLGAEEREHLRHTFALRERTIELLRAARDEAAADVARLGQGRTAVRGYSPAGHGARPTVDATG